MKKYILLSLFFVSVLALSANAPIVVDPPELELAMVPDSYTIQEILVFNQSSVGTEVEITAEPWMNVYPSQFKVKPGEYKKIVCTFLVKKEESADRTSVINFIIGGKEKLVLPVKVFDPIIKQRAQEEIQKKNEEQDKEEEITRLKRQLEQKDIELAEKDTKIAELNGIIKEKDKEIVRLGEEKNQELAEQDKKIRGEFLAIIEQKDKEITLLKENNGQKAETIADDPILQVYREIIFVLCEDIQKGKAEVRKDEKSISVKIFSSFPQGMASPKKEVKEQLAEIGKVLTRLSPGARVEVRAYADNVKIGRKLAKEYPTNQELTEDRGRKALSYLKVKRGVAKGEGSKNPVADNATPQGRAKNRRVEIIITPQ